MVQYELFEPMHKSTFQMENTAEFSFSCPVQFTDKLSIGRAKMAKEVLEPQYLTCIGVSDPDAQEISIPDRFAIRQSMQMCEGFNHLLSFVPYGGSAQHNPSGIFNNGQEVIESVQDIHRTVKSTMIRLRKLNDRLGSCLGSFRKSIAVDQDDSYQRGDLFGVIFGSHPLANGSSLTDVHRFDNG